MSRMMLSLRSGRKTGASCIDASRETSIAAA
jgi:hypothetical protein